MAGMYGCFKGRGWVSTFTVNSHCVERVFLKRLFRAFFISSRNYRPLTDSCGHTDPICSWNSREKWLSVSSGWFKKQIDCFLGVKIKNSFVLLVTDWNLPASFPGSQSSHAAQIPSEYPCRLSWALPSLKPGCLFLLLMMEEALNLGLRVWQCVWTAGGLA